MGQYERNLWVPYRAAKIHVSRSKSEPSVHLLKMCCVVASNQPVLVTLPFSS